MSTRNKHNIGVEVHLQLFGPPGTIYLIADHQDLATLQATQAKIMADEGHWALEQKAAEVLDPPTMALLQRV